MGDLFSGSSVAGVVTMGLETMGKWSYLEIYIVNIVLHFWC